jgi:glycosyltransferase involved in cell wall biosynthesis
MLGDNMNYKIVTQTSRKKAGMIKHSFKTRYSSTNSLKISFTIIAYNECKTIRDTITSVLRQKDLSNYEYEIIVVNDGSKDNTAEIVKDMNKREKRIKFVNIKINKGRGYARYTCVKKATGDIIVFIDGDIILSNFWLRRIIRQLKSVDATGGIAMPDADVSYIYKLLQFKLKPIPHTAGLTGSNSAYRKEIFDYVKLQKNMRAGYDTYLSLEIKKAGFEAKIVPNLYVEHRENTNFFKYIHSMWTFGTGASQLLLRYNKVRLADISYFGFILCVLMTLVLSVTWSLSWLILIPTYILIVSYAHLWKKFSIDIGHTPKYILAGLVHSTFIAIYFTGRFAGHFKREVKAR